MTGRKLSEQARERLLVAEAEREAAVKANEAKDQFLALVSHELRNPLAAIHGWLTLLMQNSLPASEVPGALQRIARNVRQQQRVISDLLDVSRILNGKLEIIRAPVDLANIVRDTVQECRLFAQSKDIELVVQIEPQKMVMLGDEQRLVQNLSNLLGNAIKFTPSGGRVAVKAARAGERAIVEIADSGIGMTEEELKNVFQRFWQAERASTRRHGGLGLGLTVTQYVVEQHEGLLHAASDGSNRGSTFTVELPLIELERERASAPEHRAPETMLAGICVLLVEDDPDERESTAIVLREAGAEVETASSVEQALRLVEQKPIDIVVTDLGMPGEDGFALARELQRRDAQRGRSRPLVALTGFVGASDRSDVAAAGFAAHLEKPVDYEALVARLRTLVSSAIE